MNKIIAVATNEYNSKKIKNLNNCLNDIQSVIDILLNKYDFNKTDTELILYNKPHQTTLSFLSNGLANDFSSATEEDTILLLYAGHGGFHWDLDTGYWYCSDSTHDDIRTWFDQNKLINFFKDSKAKKIALIADSCFAGSIFENNRGGGSLTLDNIRSRQALTSGGIELVDDGKPNDNSPFNKSIQKILNQNFEDVFSFNDFCEKTIQDFPVSNKQTPHFGGLRLAGDTGGSYYFKLKSIQEGSNEYNNIHYKMHLKLQINNKIKIINSVNIPYFNENNSFDAKYANIHILSLGYKIISNIQKISSDPVHLDYLIEQSSKSKFVIETDFKINRLDANYLSISINLYENFGTLHPNYYVYSINFRLKPLIQKIELIDIFKFNDIKLDLKNLILKYSEPKCRQILYEQIAKCDPLKIDFAFDDKFLYINLTNDLIHACKACGLVEIPLNELQFRI